MSRAPRVFVEGGLYHVYNRVSRGEKAFADAEEADRLQDLLCETARRDELVVLAWSILPNHYHLAVRTTTVPLWRSMASLQSRYTRGFNARRDVRGPFWQGRYQAKLVQDPRYLREVLLYVHLNPVAAGLATNPADYRWSGHREVLDRRRPGLVDAEELLLVFGTRREAARRAYLAAMVAGASTGWSAAAPGRLPWWGLGQSATEDGEELEVPADRPFVDGQGRSTGRERQRVDAATLLRAVAQRLGVPAEGLCGRTKERRLVRARELAVTLGVERYELRVRDLAQAMGARYDSVSLWGRRGAQRRGVDPTFSRHLEELDAVLSGGGAGPADRLDAAAGADERRGE